MPILSELKPPKGAVKNRKRVGRGSSSGHGKTSTRGHKGQKARSSPGMPVAFEGGQMPLHRRLPKRGFKTPFRVEYEIVNIKSLSEKFEPNSVITKEKLLQIGLIKKKNLPLKVLANGEVDKPLVVVADKFSKAAKEKLEAAGGKALLISEARSQGVIS